MKIRSKIIKNKISLGMVIPTVFLAIFLAVNVFYLIGIATFGAEISSLEQKENNLMEINRELKEKIIGASSLSSLSNSAETLGFVKTANFWYLKQGELTTAKLP